jgi:hypothetical protein
MTDQQYEVHLSVKTDDVERFRDVCKELGVKPIIIDLQDHGGSSQMRDVMTSQKIRGTFSRAADGASITSSMLLNYGYDVVREKIETTIDNPLISTTGALPKGQYFEAHFAVKADPDDNNWDRFAHHHGLHMSRNPFKKLDDGYVVQMLTLRASRGTASDFDSVVNFIWNDLYPSERIKVEREYVLFDSNQAHEGSWGIGW